MLFPTHIDIEKEERLRLLRLEVEEQRLKNELLKQQIDKGKKEENVYE